MVGLGETTEELLETLSDLRAAGCDIATVGQYLQPYERRLPIETLLHARRIRRHPRARRRPWASSASESGPLVRSSYHARRAFDAGPAA